MDVTLRVDGSSHTVPLALGTFGAVLSEDINWQPFPAFPPSVRLAVVAGQPSHHLQSSVGRH